MDTYNEDFLTNPIRKHDGKTIIAHLSDLHFKPDTNFENDPNLKALRSSIVSKKPDLILVTGDLVENGPSIKNIIYRKKSFISALSNAKDFLISVCESCDIDEELGLLLVPGNHDYRFWGFISNKCNPELFNEVFEGFTESKLIPSLNVAICLFDSNVLNDSTINFATGFIDEAMLHDFFSGTFEEWKILKPEHKNQTDYDFNNLTKIALLHHHPMPIAMAQAPNHELTEREELLLLKNAAVFMEEVAKNDIEIILHGHRHFPGYSRAGFPIGEDSLRYIGILSAGTAGRTSPFFSYNLLIIDDEGGIEAEHLWRIAGSYSPLKSRFALLAEDEIRKNRSESFLRSMDINTHVEELLYFYDISKRGDSELKVYYNGWRSLSDDPVHSIASDLKFSKAGLPKRPYFETSIIGQSVSFEIEEETDEEIRGSVFFTPFLGKKPIHTTLSALVSNSFFFDKRDLVALTTMQGNPQEREFIFAKVRYSVKKLFICIKYPEVFRPIDLQVEVLNTLNLNILDRRETEYCKDFMYYDDNTNKVFFLVPKPLTGFLYKISWNLPEDFEALKLKPFEQGIVKELRKKLLGIDSNTSKAVGHQLSSLKNEIINSHEFRQFGSDSRFEISLMGFDEERRSLKLVAIAPCDSENYTQTHEIWSREYFLGEGVAGQALRRKSPTLYSKFIKRQDGYPLFKPSKPCESALSDAYTLVYSIPLRYPLREDGAVIGVLSLATCSNVCGLHKLVEDEAVLAAIHDQAIDNFGSKIMVAIGFNNS